MASPVKRPIGPYHGGHPGVGAGDTSPKVLTSKQIMALMRVSGFPNNPQVLATGAAVVQCESANGANRGTIENGGCNTAGACGPWQIGVGGVGSGAASDHGISVGCANDWYCATKAAAKLYKQSGWKPWTASQPCWSGAVGTKLNDAKVVSSSSPSALQPALIGVIPGGGMISALDPNFPNIPGIGGLPNPLSGIEAIGAFFNLLATPTFWLRIGKGLLGLVLLILGVVALMKALLGVDLPGYANALVKQRVIGVGVARTPGERARSSRSGRLSAREAARRAGMQQEAREAAKSRGRDQRTRQFFERLNENNPSGEPPF